MSVTLTYCPVNLRGAWQIFKSQATLLQNFVSLTGGTVASSVLGFGYWWVAARSFSLETVGLAAAAVSVMSLIALVSGFGLTTVLIGETLASGKNGFRLISASLALSFLSGCFLGALFILFAKSVLFDLGRITLSSAGIGCFVLGCGVTSLTSIVHSAFAGLLRSSFQMYESLFLSALKLALLVSIAATLGANAREDAVFAAWAGAQAASAVAFTLILSRLNKGRMPLPRFGILRPLLKTSLSHHLLDMVIHVPAIVMPFLVTVLLSPAVNAAFNSAWMLLRVACLLPAALSTVMFAVGRSEPSEVASRIRLGIVVLASCSIAVTLVLTLFSATILSVFKPEYADIASSSLKILSLSYCAVSVKALYLVVKRLDRQMLFAACVFAVGGCLEFAFASIGACTAGLNGLAAGWTFAALLQAAFMVLPVMRAAALRVRACRAFGDTAGITHLSEGGTI